MFLSHIDALSPVQSQSAGSAQSLPSSTEWGFAALLVSSIKWTMISIPTSPKAIRYQPFAFCYYFSALFDL